MSSQTNSLCNCGCNGDNRLLTPADTFNLPGLSALQYRVGTHYSFKQSMLAALSKYQALTKLTSRYDNDMSIAALDGWAAVLDVLSFYQERIINEGYLRTATERLSVLELARHISYRLKPGVAAGTFLAFTMNEAPGAPASAVIPVGTKVQSVPEQNQLPQVFETIEQVEAKVEWNAIPLQTTVKFIPGFGDTQLFLKGILTGLQPGDGILMIGNERGGDGDRTRNENWDFRRITQVIPDNNLGITKVTWSRGLGKMIGTKKINPAKKNFKVYALRQRASLFGYNAPDFRTQSLAVKREFIPSGLWGQYYNGVAFNQFVFARRDADINNSWGAGSPGGGVAVDNFSVIWSGYVLAPVSGNISFHTVSDDGVRLWIDDQLMINAFIEQGATEYTTNVQAKAGELYKIRVDYFEKGGSATIQLLWTLPGQAKQVIPSQFLSPDGYTDWPGFDISSIAGVANTIHLDNIYPKIVKGSWLVLSTNIYDEVYRVEDAGESSRKAFTLTSKTTAITVSGENLVEQFNTHVRDAIIYTQSELLEIADMPVINAIKDYQEITLKDLMPGLKADQHIIISGKRNRLLITEDAGNVPFNVPGVEIADRRRLAAGESLIILSKPLTDIKTGITTWMLEDSGGTQGNIAVTIKAWQLIPSLKDDGNVSELHVIQSVKQNTAPTVISLKDQLNNSFDPITAGICANIAASTHGETKQETAGSGNSSRIFQTFVLKQNPLTYTSDASVSGAKSTLQLRINDILWNEVPSFYGASSKEKVYTTAIADDGKVTVKFGDGITGARLPTGTENVKATYRTGIGSDGLLKASQLSLLMTPQLGVNKVVNPLPSSGAEDPEQLDHARQNAPFTVLTLDRIVSVKDYEDFARAFAGIGKARAEVFWNGEKQAVHITIAAADGGPVDAASELYTNLSGAIRLSGHSNNEIFIDSYTAVTFSVNARILIDNAYVFDKVKEKVIQSLQEKFSFDARDFGQDVTPSEVITAIQQAEGVLYVDLEQLDGNNPFPAGGHFRLVAATAGLDNDTIVPAELLTVNAAKITITQIPS